MSDSGKDDRKSKRKKKKKPREKAPKLPNKIQVIKNVEKGSWNEKWDKPKNRSIACLPHPFRIAALGGVGRGKTNTLKNLFLTHQSTRKPFKELYIITCDSSSKEFLDLEPTAIMDQFPDLGIFDPKKKTCVIIDDFEWEKSGRDALRSLSTLMRFISSHRNVSVMVGYQSFFDCPKICRKCANVFLIYKPNSRQELTTIANRVGVDADDMHRIFKVNTDNPICGGIYDSLMIDLIPGSPYPMRKNVYYPIDMKDMRSDSDQSESESESESEDD